MYQTIIIGGGSSGLMAAVAASEQSQNVLLLEKKRVWVENLKFQVVVDAMLQIVYLTQKL